MRRRLAIVLAAASVLLGSSLVVDPAEADPAASIDDRGWWWRAQQNPDVLLPGPPNVQEGQLLVQSGPEGALALAAVAGTLEPGQANPVLTLKVAEGGDAGGSSAVVLACQAGATWKGGHAQAWPQHPPPACEAGGVKGERAEDGATWTFDLGSLQFTDKVNVVIVPGTVEGQPEGANHATFSLTFEGPTTESLQSSAGAPPLTTTPPAVGGGVSDPGVGGGASFDSPAIDTGGFSVPPVEAALPDEEQGLTPVAPSTQAAQPLLPASALPDPRSPHARAVGVVLLLLGGAVMYALTRRQQPIGPEGVPGGLGRWASPRWGTPPSLRG
jgi:hypothetical protein